MSKKKKSKNPTSVSSVPASIHEKLKELQLEDLHTIPSVDERFKRLMIKFVRYLRQEGYLISTDALLKFFSLYQTFDVFQLNDVKYATKMLFAKDTLQYETFEDHFTGFFYGLTDFQYVAVKEEFVREEATSRQGELSEQVQQKENELQQLQREYEVEQEHQTRELEERLAQIEQEKQQLEATYCPDQFQYRRKKESNEKEIQDWLTTHLTQIEEALSQLSSSPQQNQQFIDLLITPPIELPQKLIQLPRTIDSQIQSQLNQLMLQHLLKETQPDPMFNQMCLMFATILTKTRQFVDKKARDHANQQAQLEYKESQERQAHNQSKQIHQQKERQIQQEMNHLQNRIQQAHREIEKEFSLQHRPEFIEGHNSVRLLAQETQMDLLNQPIEKMNQTQYQQLTHVIKANSSKFRTRLSRAMIRHKHKRFNYQRTMKESLKTYGVPLELFYEKPKIKKTKIICFLDVSGSCSKSAQLLLRFVYELSSLFKGGVKSYVFIRQLADVSDLLNESRLEDAIPAAMQAVPRGYSDYHFALQTFQDEHLQEVDRNTIVLFLGDARNNQNASGVEIIETISERAKAVHWLNTEEKAKWNINDSIIATYAPHLNAVHEILTTHDLITFLEGFKLN